ncbi:MAG TPA: lytic transglycosylase domain-containing protein [Candidatus Lustribacter sp.]|jgi:soluble lytic murein transglycosylase-like protein|nr:lytic transglycosylase domain-containing protein [Candidatus Lustribacter sp.]
MDNIFSDLSAIQNRIAEISGAPPAGAVVPAPTGGFNAALAQALMPELMPPDTAAPDAPAPVPPEQINQLVQQNADIWQVDPALIKSVIANESSFNANATSPVGAQGLMQLMPETAASLGVKNPYDPAQNVAGGTRYLRGLLDRFKGDTRLAVAAYNAGPNAVEKYGDVPPYAETQNYVQNVLGSLDRYRSQP